MHLFHVFKTYDQQAMTCLCTKTKIHQLIHDKTSIYCEGKRKNSAQEKGILKLVSQRRENKITLKLYKNVHDLINSSTKPRIGSPGTSLFSRST